MCGTETWYNEPRYNGIPDMTNTIQKHKLKIYPDITNKRHQAAEVDNLVPRVSRGRKREDPGTRLLKLNA